MAKRKKIWIYSPTKKSKPQVPDSLKVEFIQKANQIIQNHFNPWRVEFDKDIKEN